MKVAGIKEQIGTTRKLKILLGDTNLKIHGVYYDNEFFTQRHLSRAQALIDPILLEEDEIKVRMSMRLEKVGVRELENTLDMLVKHSAGDLPGFNSEGMYENALQGGATEEQPKENIDAPQFPEVISVKQQLFTVDLVLILRDYKITYQDFTIAKQKFTLLTITDSLGGELTQSVSLLFGAVNKLYLFSHFFNENLTLRDSKLILDLIVDENITGKALTTIRLETKSGVGTSLYPLTSLIGSYKNISGDYIFSTDTGYIRIPYANIGTFRMTLDPVGTSGMYQIILESSSETITIQTE